MQNHDPACTCPYCIPNADVAHVHQRATRVDGPSDSAVSVWVSDSAVSVLVALYESLNHINRRKFWQLRGGSMTKFWFLIDHAEYTHLPS